MPMITVPFRQRGCIRRFDGKSYELSPVDQSVNFLQEDSPFAPRIQSSPE